ncbi:MFS transporter [Bacillus sp. CGMCC 1.16607]|uniref:MFS transporter n=1 Tax=Bacillus sp. CGMCC 1.16607 TaxID=3351842 RepID=UPI00362EB653
MNELYKDRRFYFILAANLLSSIGSGITMIAVPWLLVSKGDGATIFGYATIAMTVINFIMSPFIGQWIDRFSRKKMLMIGEAIGFLMILGFAISGFAGIEYGNWHYMILYGTGSFYYNLFYPGMFALNQEIFPKSVYKSLNGAMEIQGQLSSVIAGALAALVIGKINLEWMLLFDAMTYISAFCLFWAIPYVRGEAISENADTFWLKLTEGYRYMKKRPKLFFFLMASFMPFIGVMVTNYLFPVYLSDVLKVDGSIYGAQSMVYGIGAVLAGLLIPVLSNKLGNQNSIVLTTLIYTMGISVIVFVKIVPLYLVFISLLAFGNAGTRVARNSYLMDSVPNQIVGRVDSLFRTIGLGIRVLLLTLFTYVNSELQVHYSFYALAALLITSLVIVIFTKNTSQKKADIILKEVGQS